MISDKADQQVLTAHVTSINSALATKAPLSVINDLQEDLLFKVDGLDVYQKTDLYTRAETDALLAVGPDLTQIYDKSEVDARLAQKADASAVYSKMEIDSMLLNITSNSDNWGYLTSDFNADWGFITDPVTITEDYGDLL